MNKRERWVVTGDYCTHYDCWFRHSAAAAARSLVVMVPRVATQPHQQMGEKSTPNTLLAYRLCD